MCENLNKTELMERFGDLEFLHSLWLKARAELPSRLEELKTQLASVPSEEDFIGLSKQLHKLRGLIANFMTEKESVPKLVSCEKHLEIHSVEELPAMWKSFEASLSKEVEHLEAWLSSQGYPC